MFTLIERTSLVNSGIYSREELYAEGKKVWLRRKSERGLIELSKHPYATHSKACKIINKTDPAQVKGF